MSSQVKRRWEEGEQNVGLWFQMLGYRVCLDAFRVTEVFRSSRRVLWKRKCEREWWLEHGTQTGLSTSEETMEMRKVVAKSHKYTTKHKPQGKVVELSQSGVGGMQLRGLIDCVEGEWWWVRELYHTLSVHVQYSVYTFRHPLQRPAPHLEKKLQTLSFWGNTSLDMADHKAGLTTAMRPAASHQTPWTMLPGDMHVHCVWPLSVIGNGDP